MNPLRFDPKILIKSIDKIIDADARYKREKLVEENKDAVASYRATKKRAKKQYKLLIAAMQKALEEDRLVTVDECVAINRAVHRYYRSTALIVSQDYVTPKKVPTLAVLRKEHHLADVRRALSAIQKGSGITQLQLRSLFQDHSYLITRVFQEVDESNG